MLPRGHRILFRKRQGNLILQPGSGIVFGGGDQGSASNDNPQPSQPLVNSISSPTMLTSGLGSAASSGPSGSIFTSQGSATSQSPLKMSVQSLGASSSPSVTPSGASFSSVLFGPGGLSGISGLGTSAASSPTTESMSTPASSSQSSSSSSELISSSNTSIAPVDGSSTSGTLLTSSTAPSSQSSATVSVTPMSDVTPTQSGHSAQFYAGIAFLVIVVVACILSLVAWLLRSRRSRPSWCCGGSADDDAGGQEANMGLGLFLEKHADESGSARMPLTSDRLDAHRPYTLPIINRISDSPYPTMTRPSPAHVRMDTFDPPGQLLGPLQVKNYMAGDFSSSSENLTKPSLPREPMGTSGGTFGHDVFGSPRFLAPTSQTSPVPWVPNVKTVRTPEQVHVTSFSARRSLRAHHEDGHDSDIPPLPSPHFNRSDIPMVEECSTDGWGAALRSSFFSALSAVKGQSTKVSEDRFTSLPSRGNSASRKTFNGVGNVFPSSFKALEIKSGISLSDSAPELRTKQDSSFDTEKRCSEDELYNTTAPLTLRKKNTLNGLGISDALDTPRGIIRTSSRASSIYTCTPGMPGGIAGKKMSGRRGTVGRLSGPSLLGGRPPFLKRGSSVTSFNSDSSDDARGQTDEEMFAKRVMMLRARRKKAMSRRPASFLRQPSTTVSRSGSKRREAQK